MYKEKLSQLLAEDAGNLSMLPKHAIKLATKRGAGRKSDVASVDATSHHSLKKALHSAVGNHSAVAVHVNGKHVGTIHTNDDYTQKQKYGFHHADGSQTSNTVNHYPRRSHYSSSKAGGQAYSRAKPRTSTNTHYSKSDIVDHAIGMMHKHADTNQGDRGAYKAHKFSVHAVSSDTDRRAKQAERQQRKPGRTPGYDNHYGDAGLNKNLDKAAGKMASKLVSDSGHAKTAMDHHSKIGSMIKAGDHAGAMKHLDTLKNHLYQAGRAKADFNSVKGDVKNMKSKSEWTRNSARDRLRKLNEQAEMIEELSKGTLGRYVKRAARQMADKEVDKEFYADERNKANRAGNTNSAQKWGTAKTKAMRTARRRSKGIDRAVNKLTNEEHGG